MDTNTNAIVYTAADIKNMLGISRAATYDLIDKAYKGNNKPFRVIKIGRSVRIPKDSFDNWFNTSDGVAL